MTRAPLDAVAALFPPSFTWGVAASAYQTEGVGDGRGESIWDRFCATPGKVRAGQDARIACDSFHRQAEDTALLAGLGVDAFRFSVSWPRVLPNGRGPVRPAGLDLYDRLVDALLARGIAPYPTLFHWELPQPLEDAGGWTVRDTAEAFAAFVEAVAERIGDRVPAWITHNEPWCAAWLGYGYGLHAPGRASRSEALAAGHHLLLSHGLAVDALRAACPHAEVGITIDVYPMHPASPSPEDAAAARRADGHRNRWFLDPVLLGSYPADMLELYEPDLPRIDDGDLRTIAAPLDFLGVNHYSRTVVRAGAAGEPEEVRVPGALYTDVGWEVYPAGMRETLERIHADYAPPALMVTENGACFTDVRDHAGRVADVERCDYLEAYVAQVGSALAEGVPVRGYFVWSLLDNFEWALGYQRRFGLVYVDYPTLERVRKQSWFWYRDLIARSRELNASVRRAAVG